METPNDTPAPQALAPAPVAASVEPDTRAERLYPDDQPMAELPKQDAPQAREEPKAPAQEPPKPDTEGFQLNMPEGLELDAALLSSAVPVFKDAGISEEQASKLVPLVTQVQERFQQSQLDAMDALKKDWAKQAKDDREVGGKNWGETTRLLGVAMKHADQDVRELFNVSGLGNHPAIIRWVRNIGRELERMQSQSGKPRMSTIEADRDHHQKTIYPNDPPKNQKTFAPRGDGRSRSERSYPNDQPK